MANQKITDLNKLLKLSKDDLFIVVDRNSKSTSSSPTGETKGISAAVLSTQLNEIAEGETGIDFKNLRDVPDSYEGFAGGYIKLRKDGDGIEFTESPGSSEMSYDWGDFTQKTPTGVNITYNPGDVVRMSGEKFTKASATSIESAESVGIIRNIRYLPDSDGNTTGTIELDAVTNIETQRGTPDKISVVFNGLVEWDYDIGGEIGPVTLEQENPLWGDVGQEPTKLLKKQTLVAGTTYFLGTQGTLCDFDPTSSSRLDTQISKPMLVATSSGSGIVVNYRGIICDAGDQPHKFIIPVSATCNSIKVGDILRIKRQHIRTHIDDFNTSTWPDVPEPENVLPPFLGREGGTTVYALSNAASQYKTSGDDSPAEDDNYACDMLGIVTSATSDDFEIQTSGMVEFTLPEYDETYTNPETNATTVTRNFIPGLFKPGYRYYLDSFPINSDPLASTNSVTELRSSVYEHSTSDFSSYMAGSDLQLTAAMRPAMEGEKPFRNSSITDPFARDATTGKIISYSKPVFYAVSPNKILLLNHPAYPNPKDRCNAVDPLTWSPCAVDRVETRNISVTRTQPFNDLLDMKQFSTEFLETAWMSASTNDTAIITYVFEGTLPPEQQQFETHTFTKTTTGVETNWYYQAPAIGS